jgi:hypothetical protein
MIDNLVLPAPEDSTIIQESLGRIFAAIVCDSLDSKKATQLLWGLQIAVQTIPRKPQKDPRSVESITLTEDGAELAPVLNVCLPGTDCKKCDKAQQCPCRFDFDQVFARKKDGDGHEYSPLAEFLRRETGAGSAAASTGTAGDGSSDGSGENSVDKHPYKHLFASSPDYDDDDDDDGEDDPRQPLQTLEALRELAEALEIGKDG